MLVSEFRFAKETMLMLFLPASYFVDAGDLIYVGYIFIVLAKLKLVFLNSGLEEKRFILGM